MINEETVFILGAGASCPYGFPTAAKLREKICSDIYFAQTCDRLIKENTETLTENLKKYMFLSKQNKLFRKKFEGSQINSIDHFLALNKNFENIGKLSIAYQILHYEANSNLNKDWLSHLFNKMLEDIIRTEHLEKINANKVKFVTFNYDRTVEHFFFSALSDAFSRASNDSITEVIRNIPIHHVYSPISPLPWQETNGIEYGQRMDFKTLTTAASNVKTIHEVSQDINNDNLNLEDAKEWIKNAKKIFFLGFGYAKENMDILGLPQIIPPYRRVYGTGLNLEEGERGKISTNIVTGMAENKDFPGRENTTKIENMDCLKLLRNYL